MDSGGSIHRSYRIQKRIHENPRTISLVLEGSISARPGQFAMLWLPGVDEKPFSISAANPLEFTISSVGPFSAALHALHVGDTLWARGPFGVGFRRQRGGRTLLVGGGYGAAPLAFLAAEIASVAETADGIAAALGARTDADLLFLDRFEKMGVAVHAATEDGSRGTPGRVTDVVVPLLSTGSFSRVCACGPERMLEAVAQACRTARVDAELSHEAYMRCGVGLCGACEHKGRLVCMEGPVFFVPARETVREKARETTRKRARS